jgi:hypothetical protein
MSNLNPKQSTLLLAAALLGFLVLLGLNMSSDDVLQDPGEIDLNSSELIGYWSFDAEDRNSTHVFDLSTNGNDGIIHGTEFVGGIDGEAAYFDGLGD